MVSAPRGLDVAVGIPTLFDELDAGSVQPRDVVLGVGVAARRREAVGLIEEAGRAERPRSSSSSATSPVRS